MTALKYYVALAILGFIIYYVRRWNRKTINGNKITKEKLKIYSKYNGDGNQFVRVGQDYEKALFENQDWGTIDNYLHNLEMIKKRLTSKEFIDTTIKELKEICDKQSFEDLTTG